MILSDCQASMTLLHYVVSRPSAHPFQMAQRRHDIALNRIFYTGRFRDAFTARFRLCPRGLTMSCCTNDEDTAPTSFCVCVKRYGYESLSNNGFEYSDMGDYEIDFAAEERLTPEMEEFCVEYIKQVDAELYETVKKLWKK